MKGDVQCLCSLLQLWRHWSRTVGGFVPLSTSSHLLTLVGLELRRQVLQSANPSITALRGVWRLSMARSTVTGYATLTEASVTMFKCIETSLIHSPDAIENSSHNVVIRLVTRSIVVGPDDAAGHHHSNTSGMRWQSRLFSGDSDSTTQAACCYYSTFMITTTRCAFLTALLWP